MGGNDGFDAAEFKALLVGAQGGSRVSLETLKALYGHLPRFWTEFGLDVARRAEDALAARICGDDLLSREAVRSRMAEMRAALAGPAPAPLELLLVERVVALAFQLYDAEHVLAARLKRGMSEAELRFLERRVDGVHKRYLAAVRALATVRRLQLPAVQVNVADKQVNIARG